MAKLVNSSPTAESMGGMSSGSKFPIHRVPRRTCVGAHLELQTDLGHGGSRHVGLLASLCKLPERVVVAHPKLRYACLVEAAQNLAGQKRPSEHHI